MGVQYFNLCRCWEIISSSRHQSGSDSAFIYYASRVHLTLLHHLTGNLSL